MPFSINSFFFHVPPNRSYNNHSVICEAIKIKSSCFCAYAEIVKTVVCLLFDEDTNIPVEKTGNIKCDILETF